MQVTQTTKNHLALFGMKPQKAHDTKKSLRPFSSIVKNESFNIWQLPYSDDILILLQTNFLKNLSACTFTQWKETPVSFCFANKQLFPLQYEKDENQYLLIDKRPKLRDYSIVGVLNILKATHKISKSQYQQSKRSLEKGDGLRNSILQKVNMFLKNVRLEKEYKHKTTTQTRLKNRETHIINGGYYSVLMKTYADKMKHDISERVASEVSTKYKSDNKIIYNWS